MRLSAVAMDRRVFRRYRTPTAPADFSLDGVQVDILRPEAEPNVVPLAKNHGSMVVLLKFRDRTIRWPGDAEKEVQYQMLGENDPCFLHSDILKVCGRRKPLRPPQS